MWPGQMSLWQLESVQDGPGNQPLKFGQNRIRASWDIADFDAKLILNFNFNLVERWDGYILNYSSHPATHPILYENDL